MGSRQQAYSSRPSRRAGGCRGSGRVSRKRCEQAYDGTDDSRERWKDYDVKTTLTGIIHGTELEEQSSAVVVSGPLPRGGLHFRSLSDTRVRNANPVLAPCTSANL